MFISTAPKNYWSHCELSERVIRGQFETWIQDEKIKFNHFVWGGEWESNPTRALSLHQSDVGCMHFYHIAAVRLKLEELVEC